MNITTAAAIVEVHSSHLWLTMPEFCLFHRFLDKTKNDWCHRKKFQKVAGKYDMVKIDYSSQVKSSFLRWLASAQCYSFICANTCMQVAILPTVVMAWLQTCDRDCVHRPSVKIVELRRSGARLLCGQRRI
jgi:hypothetical protein